MECDAVASGPHVFRCRNRHVSVRGLAPCGHVVHTECYRANELLFNTTLNDGRGLTAKPGDARPGYTCMRCRLQAVLGRGLALDTDQNDALLYESAVMYDIDLGNVILEGTARTYTQSAAAYMRWMLEFMPGCTYRETDEPRDPPVQDRILTFGTHQEYILSNAYTHGRASGGKGVVASTALARVSGFRHLGLPGGDIERELRGSLEFKRLQVGIRKRCLHNAVPKRTLAFAAFERWTRRLRRRLRRVGLELRQALGSAAARRPLRHTIRRLRLQRASVVGQLHLLHVQVFGYTRGRVPFQFLYRYWVRGLWTRGRCVDHGLVDPEGQPMPHLRLLRHFRTKTFTSAWYEGVLAATTASGHPLLATAVSLRRALVAAGLTEGGLFYHEDGTAMTLTTWQRRCLRPELVSMREAGEPSLRGEADHDIATRWSSWSLRRLCETNFSSSSRAVPMCPRDLRIGHSGWSARERLRGHISDRYRSWPLYQKIDATRLYA